MFHQEVVWLADGNETTTIVNFHCMTRDDRVCSVEFEVFGPDDSLISKFEEQGGLVLLIRFKKAGRYTYMVKNKDKFEKLVSTAIECHKCGKTSLKKDLLVKDDVENKISKCKQIGGLINVVLG